MRTEGVILKSEGTWKEEERGPEKHDGGLERRKNWGGRRPEPRRFVAQPCGGEGEWVRRGGERLG